MSGDGNPVVKPAPPPDLPPFTQEDILALIGWREEGREVIAHLKATHFSRPGVGDIDYEVIAQQALGFWGEFGSPPGDHLYDLVLQQSFIPEDNRPQWMEILRGLKEIAPRLNVSYVTHRLLHFLHHADLRRRIYLAMEKMQRGEIEAAETALTSPGRVEAPSEFLTLASTGAVAQYLAARDEDRFLSGIPDLDRYYVGPARKELYLVMAPAKRGKSWWLIHTAKFALMARARVFHVTLEMRKEQCLQRYIQTLTASSKRPLAASRRSSLKKNEFNVVSGLEFEQMKERAGLILPSGQLNPTIVNRTHQLATRMSLVIDEFPTGTLTLPKLKARLDTLERKERFIPDMLVIDYPDLFEVDKGNYRLSLRGVFEDLRGLAQERNLALVAATQGNRGSSKSRLVTDADVAEDYSKIMTADWVLTYTQTQAEKNLGLARIFTAAGRDEQDKQVVVITQNYPTGQFCLDSALLPSDWETVMKAYDNAEPDERPT